MRAVAPGPEVWLEGSRSFRWAGVYRPIWEYHAQGLAKDLSAHLVFGTTTSAVFATLTRERP
jgi:hypothetical protein